jgi:hypothetical protein
MFYSELCFRCVARRRVLRLARHHRGVLMGYTLRVAEQDIAFLRSRILSGDYIYSVL